MAPRSLDIFPWSRHSPVVLLIVLSVVSGNARAQPATDSDWPCVQRLVAEVSAAVIWTGPLPETLNRRWQDVKPVAHLVERLTSRQTSPTEAQKLIAEFAESLSLGDKEQQLTLLFSGILETLNTRRRKYIDTIKRFTRHQKAVAAQVQQLLNELTVLAGKTGGEVDARRREVEETVRWHQRVFDQREKSILALCEQPVEVEQHLGELARTISNYLE